MPLEYNPINHGRFLQVMGELGLGPDDVAGILNKEPRRVKEWYSGHRAIPDHQLNPLWQLYLNWVNWASYTKHQIERLNPDIIALVVYTNQSDYLASPDDGIKWPTYKTHLNLIARVSSSFNKPQCLIPFHKQRYFDWLSHQSDSYDTRNQWADSEARQTES